MPAFFTGFFVESEATVAAGCLACAMVSADVSGDCAIVPVDVSDIGDVVAAMVEDAAAAESAATVAAVFS